MTDAEILTFVNTYFLVHLDKAYWAGLDDDAKAASVIMATDDVYAKLDIAEIDSTNSPSQKAIAEQAVYLTRNHDSLNENKITIGESLSGAMAETSKVIAKDAGFSHRAEKFISQALKIMSDANKITGPVYMGRG